MDNDEDEDEDEEDFDEYAVSFEFRFETAKLLLVGAVQKADPGLKAPPVSKFDC